MNTDKKPNQKHKSPHQKPAQPNQQKPPPQQSKPAAPPPPSKPVVPPPSPKPAPPPPSPPPKVEPKTTPKPTPKPPQKTTKPRPKTNSMRLNWLFFGGSMLGVIGAILNQSMLIPNLILAAVGVLMGIIGTFLSRFWLPNVGFLARILLSMAIVGGVSVFLFAAINRFVNDPIPENLNLRITKKINRIDGHGCQDEAYFLAHGFEQHLNFECESDIKSARFIDATVQKGFFGFEIVVEKQLIP